MKIKDLVAILDDYDPEMKVAVTVLLQDEDYELEDGDVLQVVEEEPCTVRYGECLIRAIQMES